MRDEDSSRKRGYFLHCRHLWDRHVQICGVGAIVFERPLPSDKGATPRFDVVLPENQDQILVLTVLPVPNWLD